MTQLIESSTVLPLPDETGRDPIEDRLRASVRATIEAMFEEELAEFLGRIRYGRGDGQAKGYRHGHRERQLTGTFGTKTVRVPRPRVEDEKGKITEWRSKALPRYQRLTKKAEALIALVYLAGTNTRRVKRALFGLFEGAVSKPSRHPVPPASAYTFRIRGGDNMPDRGVKWAVSRRYMPVEKLTAVCNTGDGAELNAAAE